ncbi:rRNA adenine N-6-methyltransferase family protein [Actinocatenispora rupis]
MAAPPAPASVDAMPDTLFVTECFRTHRSTGALVPSGRRLARALARPLRTGGSGEPRRYLEVGAGTGAVSRHLASLLGPDDTLDLVESNPRFAARLRADPVLRPYGGRVRLTEARVEDLGPGTYDGIVCGLPFANFHATEVTAILTGLLDRLTPGATLSYFSYVGLRRLGLLLAGAPEYTRLVEVEATLAGIRRRYEVGRGLVVGNVPPAWVHHLAPDRAAASPQRAVSTVPPPTGPTAAEPESVGT